MPVTKRIRYEVLKRDNHTCRYCGGTAPDVVLTVDHVTPVALGGTNVPSNLVAACRDCNYGKASTAPDAALVEDVRQDALRHAELIRQAYAVLVERMDDRDGYVETWRDHWTRPNLPADWRNTIGRWFEMGVPVELIADAADVACTRTTVRDDGRFAYMCGIVWNQVQAVDETAEAMRHIAGRFVTEDFLCDERIDAYTTGYENGADNQARILTRIDPVARVVDHIVYPKFEFGVPA